MHCVRACHPFAPHARRFGSMASVGGRNCAGYCAGLGSNRIAALAGIKKTPTNQAAPDCIVIKHASTAERRESLTPVGFAALRRRNIKVIATIALMHHGKTLPGDDRLRLASVRLRRRATSIATRTIHFVLYVLDQKSAMYRRTFPMCNDSRERPNPQRQMTVVISKEWLGSSKSPRPSQRSRRHRSQTSTTRFTRLRRWTALRKKTSLRTECTSYVVEVEI